MHTGFSPVMLVVMRNMGVFMTNDEMLKATSGSDVLEVCSWCGETFSDDDIVVSNPKYGDLHRFCLGEINKEKDDGRE